MRIAEVKTVPRGGRTCSGDPTERCGNGLEKIYPTTAVRFSYMKFLGEFTYKPGTRFTCGGKVIVQTDRGIELGEQVSLTCTGCSKSISRDQMRNYAQASGDGYLELNRGKIIREATPEDLHEERRLREQSRSMMSRCRELILKHKLPMKLVECEHLFGGERIIFYFMAESRVDFRDLVRDLASEFHTRIEMRQIGARDEARLVADYETCGMECCCKTFLKTLKPINMKMAKLQKATLDPSKVSGRCGRLKCCLRYEHETYEQLDRNLPKIGKHIHTAHGDGLVVDRQILTQLVQIETEDRKLITVVAEDILSAEQVAKKEAERPKTEAEPPGTARADAEKTGETAQRQSGPKKKRRRRRRRRARTSDNKQDPGASS